MSKRKESRINRTLKRQEESPGINASAIREVMDPAKRNEATKEKRLAAKRTHAQT